MKTLWTRTVGALRGLFAKKALEEPVQPVIPEVDFQPPAEPAPPVVMLEGVVPMPPRSMESLVDLSWADIGEPADQALPTDPLGGVEPSVDTPPLVAREPEPAPIDPAEAPQPDPEPEPPQEPVQAEALPVPIVARQEPVPEPAVPDQSEGWFGRLWQPQGPLEGEGLVAPAKIAPLLIDPLEDQPVPNWVGGGQLGFLHARVSMGGI